MFTPSQQERETIAPRSIDSYDQGGPSPCKSTYLRAVERLPLQHGGRAKMSYPHRPSDLPLAARRILWNKLWDRLLGPPREEPAIPEHIPTPEEFANPAPPSCEERPS